VVVRVYAGEPPAGGMLLGEATIVSVAAGESASVTVSVAGLTRDVTIWAVADPDDTIEECNDANNVVEGPALTCRNEPH
jgi:subtilase family serine protease